MLCFNMNKKTELKDEVCILNFNLKNEKGELVKPILIIPCFANRHDVISKGKLERFYNAINKIGIEIFGNNNHGKFYNELDIEKKLIEKKDKIKEITG